MSAWVYYAVGRCQFDRSCHGARFASTRATVVTPEYPTAEALDAELAALASDRNQRRCRCCHRPIAIKRFKRRRWDPQAEVVEVMDA